MRSSGWLRWPLPEVLRASQQRLELKGRHLLALMLLQPVQHLMQGGPGALRPLCCSSPLQMQPASVVQIGLVQKWTAAHLLHNQNQWLSGRAWWLSDQESTRVLRTFERLRGLLQAFDHPCLHFLLWLQAAPRCESRARSPRKVPFPHRSSSRPTGSCPRRQLRKEAASFRSCPAQSLTTAVGLQMPAGRKCAAVSVQGTLHSRQSIWRPHDPHNGSSGRSAWQRLKRKPCPR